MSQCVSTEAGEMVQVATNVGWSEFCDWVDATPMEDYPTLHHLTAFGFANDAEDLLGELDDAVDEHPPSDDVEDTADGLAEFLEAHAAAEIVIVSNGMVSGGEGEGEGEAEPIEAGA